ncbi:MAG TPA: hypothetical protein DEB31_07000 [Clostridiales bacterium]|nr:hypothetical protein [Clostridiales bacterium]
MVGSIIGLLKQIDGVYREIYALSEKKQEHIIANDAEAVNEIVKEEWKLLAKAGELEDKRISLVQEFLGKGKDSSSSLQDLMAAAPPDKRQELEFVSKDLKNLLEKQKQINEENRSLIELHLEYMDYMVNTVLKEPQVSDIYGNSGVVADANTANKGIIDNEA